MSLFLWIIVPYLAIAIFIGAHVWRYRYDKFCWTTRSSQLYENRLLRIGPPLSTSGSCSSFSGTLAAFSSRNRPPR